MNGRFNPLYNNNINVLWRCEDAYEWSVPPSVCPSVGLPVYPLVLSSIRLSIGLSIVPSSRLSLRWSIHWSIPPLVRPSIGPSNRLFFHWSVRWSVFVRMNEIASTMSLLFRNEFFQLLYQLVCLFASQSVWGE